MRRRRCRPLRRGLWPGPRTRGAVTAAARFSAAPPGLRPGCGGPDPQPPRPLCGPAAVSRPCGPRRGPGVCGHPWGAGLRWGLGTRGGQRGLGSWCHPWAWRCRAWWVTPLLPSRVAGTALATLPEWHRGRGEGWMRVASLQIRSFHRNPGMKHPDTHAAIQLPGVCVPASGCAEAQEVCLG